MSDFKELVRKSFETQEEYSAGFRTAQRTEYDEYAKRASEVFCKLLKNYIYERAKRREFTLVGNKRIIKGVSAIIYKNGISFIRYDDLGVDWIFKDTEKELVGYNLSGGISLYGHYDDNYIGQKRLSTNFVTRCVTELKKGGGLLHESGTCKWTQEFELSYCGKKFLEYAYKTLDNDEIVLSYSWVKRSWINTMNSTGTGDIPPCANYQNTSYQKYDNDKIIVCKQWHEGVNVYLTFEFSFEL